MKSKLVYCPHCEDEYDTAMPHECFAVYECRHCTNDINLPVMLSKHQLKDGKCPDCEEEAERYSPEREV